LSTPSSRARLSYHMQPTKNTQPFLLHRSFSIVSWIPFFKSILLNVNQLRNDKCRPACRQILPRDFANLPINKYTGGKISIIRTATMPHVQKGTWHHCPGQDGRVDGYPESCRIGPQDFCISHNKTCPKHPDWFFTMNRKCLLCLNAEAAAERSVSQTYPQFRFQQG
jgi:hypothetical protein